MSEVSSLNEVLKESKKIMKADKTYNIEVTEILQKTVEVKAKTLAEAEDIVTKMYRNQEIVLTSDDFKYETILPSNDNRNIEKAIPVEKFMENSNKENVQEKGQNADNRLYISLPKALCKQMDSKLNEGEKFNTMIIPRGTELNGKDIGGCLFNPKYMVENKFNKNEMTAIYYTDKLQDGKINILHPDNLKEKVDLKELKDSIDTRQREFKKELKEKEQQKQKQAAKKKGE